MLDPSKYQIKRFPVDFVAITQNYMAIQGAFGGDNARLHGDFGAFRGDNTKLHGDSSASSVD